MRTRKVGASTHDRRRRGRTVALRVSLGQQHCQCRCTRQRPPEAPRRDAGRLKTRGHAQNTSRAPNCRMRASREELITPKLELTLRPSATCLERCVREAQVDAIGDVEGFGSELELHPPANRHLFQEREVDVEDAWRASVRQGPADVSEFEVRWVHERVGVEPALGCRIVEFSPAEIIGPVGALVVRTAYDQRQAALEGRDRVDLPAPENVRGDAAREPRLASRRRAAHRRR